MSGEHVTMGVPVVSAGAASEEHGSRVPPHCPPLYRLSLCLTGTFLLHSHKCWSLPFNVHHTARPPQPAQNYPYRLKIDGPSRRRPSGLGTEMTQFHGHPLWWPRVDSSSWMSRKYLSGLWPPPYSWVVPLRGWERHTSSCVGSKLWSPSSEQPVGHWGFPWAPPQIP